MADLSLAAVGGDSTGQVGGARGQKRPAASAIQGQPPAKKPAGAGTSAPASSVNTTDIGDGLERAHMLNQQREYEGIEKTKLSLKIRAWASAFPGEVGDLVKGIDLDKADYSSLISLFNQIQFTVATRTTGIVSQAGVESGLEYGEVLLGATLGLSLSGPNAKLSSLKDDQNFRDLVKETTLYYADWIYSKPIYRLMWYTFQKGMTVHKINTGAGITRIAPSGQEAQDAIAEARKLRESPQ